MHLRRRSAVKYGIAAYVGAALYCEWFVYLAQPLFWPALECPNEESCMRILFIADPQLQGDYAVPPPLNYLFNWDSDRYLKSTFSVLTKYFKPDVMVYLGDLMDEGSISTLAQFHNYAKRLFNIFELNYTVEQIWLPGDNDIGGEFEPVRWDKISEFNHLFDQRTVITTQNISFYKVNGIINGYPKHIEGNGTFRIVISHYPVTLRLYFGQQVNNEIHPNIYFCAHDHESKYVRQNKQLKSRVITHYHNSEVLHIPHSDEILYEIYVPTCSYRMGTMNIGYGAAVIDTNTHEMRYTVFWSPGRFPYLFFYLALLILLILYCLVFCAAKLFHRQNTTWISDKQPLMDKI